MKINDTKLYLYFSIITLVIGILLGAVSYYSILVVEPRAQALISDEANVGANYRAAYGLLRNPQIFARYENFDQDERWIKNVVIPYMDEKIVQERSFTQDEKVYLEALLKRRQEGSVLGRNTMAFFLLLSAMGWGFLLYEMRKVRQQGA